MEIKGQGKKFNRVHFAGRHRSNINLYQILILQQINRDFANSIIMTAITSDFLSRSQGVGVKTHTATLRIVRFHQIDFCDLFNKC